MPHTYFLDPLDVLLFRDGRPRVTGDSHLMTGPFPPPPSALYGAFRSALLAQDDARFTPLATQSGDGYAPTGATAPFQNRSDAVAEAVGTPAQTGTLTLDRVLLAQRTSSGTVPLFPAGLDLVRPKDDARDGERLLLRPVDDGPIRTSLPEGLRRLAVPSEEDFLEALPAYLTPDAFTRYLQGLGAGLPLAAMQAGPEAPFGVSARTSVMLEDAGGTAADGMLYTTEFVRLREERGARYGFAVTVSGAPSLTNPFLRLGAEQRAAKCLPAQIAEPDFAAVLPRPQKCFRLVLAAPAPFDSGWRPGFLDDDLTGTLGGCAVRLRAAAVGRYVHVGGWDLVRARPRPARRAVPTGSVYFFDVVEGDPAGLADVHGRSLFPHQTTAPSKGSASPTSALTDLVLPTTPRAHVQSRQRPLPLRRDERPSRQRPQRCRRRPRHPAGAVLRPPDGGGLWPQRRRA